MPINDNPISGWDVPYTTPAARTWKNFGYVDPAELPVRPPDTEDPSLKVWNTKDSGKRTEFANGGQRDTQEGKPRFDLIYPQNVPYEEQLVTRWAALMGRGAEKYEDRNWEKFSDPAALDRAKSSAARHFVQWLAGETDEDHAAAVLFNIEAAEYVKGILAGKWKPLEAT